MFLADLHIHSKYSRATSRDLDLEHLFIAAQLKGVSVVGTGDFTHPGWFSEIREKLVPSETGLFELRPDIAADCARKVPESCRRPVRFLLATEISNIYKKDGKTRKNHNLVFVEGLAAAKELARRLERIGNIGSDGRPILGLDARDLLEIVLSTADSSFLIPAHIWTPWFSLFGSKSGFNSIAECFGDLADEIFAVETGLSSDPPMNWRVADLDRRTLVSNSDAHSPGKLAREATLFNCAQSYTEIRDCLKSGDPDRFRGTVEFYPEEGKYHFDGHRKCGVRLSPEQSRRHSGRCPRCGQPLTLGVLHRVEELADAPAGRLPERAADFISLVPLEDILSELLEVGPKTKKVANATRRLLERFGSEFDILYKIAPERLAAAPVPLFSEAIRRMRERRIHIEPGYDGEFGKVRIFEPGERRRLLGQKRLFPAAPIPRESKKPIRDALFSEMPTIAEKEPGRPVPSVAAKIELATGDLNPEQREAQRSQAPALLVVAGPGTGKTRTLTGRIAHMVSAGNVPADKILAVTFTNQAAREMSLRLSAMGMAAEAQPTVATFHGLCLAALRESGRLDGMLIDEDAARRLIFDAVRMVRAEGCKIAGSGASLANRIEAVRQRALAGGDAPPDPDPTLLAVYRRYEQLLRVQLLFDYEELIARTCRLMEEDAAFQKAQRDRFHHLLIDEYQDLNPIQYRLVRLLVPKAGAGRTIAAVGDPDQSIYGFRGSDSRFFFRFGSDYPNAVKIVLSRNYRSTDTILKAAHQVVQTGSSRREPIFSGIDGPASIEVVACRSERAEAVAVGKMIEQEVGGSGFHAVDFGKVDSAAAERSFSDFAVLMRTARQMDVFEEVLTAAGIPVTAVRKDRVYPEAFRKLFALVRLAGRQPSYADVEEALGLFGEGIGQKTFDAFRNWAFGNRLGAQAALEKAWKIPIAAMSATGQKRFCEAYKKVSVLSEALNGLEPADVLAGAAEASGLADAIRADEELAPRFERLIREAGKGRQGIERLLCGIALETDTDALSARSESVRLLTLHGAKGLEFPVVFIAGCEQGLIPLADDSAGPDALSEERRIFYVGMTRAMERLVLCWSKKRKVFGRSQDRTISPFVSQIEERLLKETRQPGRTLRFQRQLELFQ